MSDELTPITRKETFLAKAGGQNVVTPTPITREETFLQAIIDNGSGGGGGTGGGATIATGTYDEDSGNYILDKTFAELKAAYLSGMVAIHIQFDEHKDHYYTVTEVRSDTTLSPATYDVFVIESNSGSTIPFTTNTIDGYPDGYIE